MFDDKNAVSGGLFTCSNGSDNSIIIKALGHFTFFNFTSYNKAL